MIVVHTIQRKRPIAVLHKNPSILAVSMSASIHFPSLVTCEMAHLKSDIAFPAKVSHLLGGVQCPTRVECTCLDDLTVMVSRGPVAQLALDLCVHVLHVLLDGQAVAGAAVGGAAPTGTLK